MNLKKSLISLFLCLFLLNFNPLFSTEISVQDQKVIKKVAVFLPKNYCFDVKGGFAREKSIKLDKLGKLYKRDHRKICRIVTAVIREFFSTKFKKDNLEFFIPEHINPKLPLDIVAYYEDHEFSIRFFQDGGGKQFGIQAFNNDSDYILVLGDLAFYKKTAKQKINNMLKKNRRSVLFFSDLVPLNVILVDYSRPVYSKTEDGVRTNKANVLSYIQRVDKQKKLQFFDFKKRSKTLNVSFENILDGACVVAGTGLNARRYYFVQPKTSNFSSEFKPCSRSGLVRFVKKTLRPINLFVFDPEIGDMQKKLGRAGVTSLVKLIPTREPTIFIAPYNNELFLKVIFWGISPNNIKFILSDDQDLSFDVCNLSMMCIYNVPLSGLDGKEIKILYGNNEKIIKVPDIFNAKEPVYFFSDIQGQYTFQVRDNIQIFNEGKRGSVAWFLNSILPTNGAAYISIGDFVSYSGRSNREREFPFEWFKAFNAMGNMNGKVFTSALGIPHDIAYFGGVRFKSPYDVITKEPTFNYIFNQVKCDKNKLSPVEQVSSSSNWFIKDRVLYLNLPLSSEEIGKKYNFNYTPSLLRKIEQLINMANAKKACGEVDFVVVYAHLPLINFNKYSHPGLLNIAYKEGAYKGKFKNILKDVGSVEVDDFNHKLFGVKKLNAFEYIAKLILDSQIDVYLSGHNHIYERNEIKVNGRILHSIIMGTGVNLRSLSKRDLELHEIYAGISRRKSFAKNKDLPLLDIKYKYCLHSKSPRALLVKPDIFTLATIKHEDGRFHYIPSYMKLFKDDNGILKFQFYRAFYEENILKNVGIVDNFEILSGA